MYMYICVCAFCICFFTYLVPSLNHQLSGRVSSNRTRFKNICIVFVVRLIGCSIHVRRANIRGVLIVSIQMGIILKPEGNTLDVQESPKSDTSLFITSGKIPTGRRKRNACNLT